MLASKQLPGQLRPFAELRSGPADRFLAEAEAWRGCNSAAMVARRDPPLRLT
jgi:hypothetical protein